MAQLIAANRTHLGVPHAASCRLLGVSESWFYKWRARAPTLRELRRRDLDRAVLAAFVASDGTYGSPRAAEELPDDAWGYRRRPSPPNGPPRAQCAPHTEYTQGTEAPGAGRCDAAGPPGGNFATSAPNQKWCGDFKQIPTDEAPCI